jgi:hypothetical protein
MSRFTTLYMLAVVGLTGCLSTQTKTGLARPDFSKQAPVTSSVAVVKSSSCSKPVVDLTTPPEPQKGKKIIGELPEYQDEDNGSF